MIKRKERSSLLTGFFFLLIFTHAAGQDNGMANTGAIVKPNEHVRFTVLTQGLIRMEWDSLGTFTNSASFVIVNRKLPVPSYSISNKGGWVIIKTAVLELHYKLHSGKFTAGNIWIKYTGDKHTPFTWRPGMSQKNNLKGTARTLDTYDGDTSIRHGKLELGNGLLSKDGWFFWDDSKSLLFDNSSWPWVKQRSEKEQDWYFMGYGHHYKLALADFTRVAGKVPLPPRYAFGYWWSRYWSYSDNELRDLMSQFKRYDVPLDVLILDMDWHLTDSMNAKSLDEFGQRKWWTGWTWDKSLFPDPEKFLKWTESKKLEVALNLHPASGVAPFEARYGTFAKSMGFDTTAKKNIPFVASDKRFMENLFNVILRPMEKAGVDFWWLDWQQWKQDKKIPELNNTWWLNYAFFTDMQKNRKERPLIFHRWGGMGNHRYQIGFSGDAIVSWKTLQYQPYFTSTASNVLFGYWGHDLGGHTFKQGQDSLDPELFTRWMQFGALSPIFRTHSSKNDHMKKAVWNFKGDYFDAIYHAIRLRYDLAPYIYTMARKDYDMGISLCRPMYYDYPNMQQAYDYKYQYQFGDDILVSPIGAPSVNGFSKVTVWLPPGNDWYEWNTGTMLKGGQILDRRFSIDEYPMYLKAGAIIPMYPEDVNNLKNNPGRIRLGVFPGGSGDSARLYEDSGNDQQYGEQYAYTAFQTKVVRDKSLTLTIFPRIGSYQGMPRTKQYVVTLYGTKVPDKVLIDGKPASYSPCQVEGTWYYDGRALNANIILPPASCDRKVVIQVDYAGKQIDLNGLPEKFKRLSKATQVLRAMEARNRVVFPVLIGNLEETDREVEYHPDQFGALINTFKENFLKIPESIRQLNISEASKKWYLNYLDLDTD